MYCVGCGSQNPDYGKFCHNCGNRLVSTKSELVSRVHMEQVPTENDLLLQIVRIDQKLNQCHRCGSSDEEDLNRIEFGIAKVVSVKRDWSETLTHVGLSAALSAATLPLIGIGGIRWKNPSKTTSFRLLEAQLVLCRECLSWARLERNYMRAEAYRCHPWAEKARAIGYDRYLSVDDLRNLKPIS